MQIPKISQKGFLLLNFVSSASISATTISPALPRLETFYHLKAGQLEWVMSIFLFGYMLGQLLYGPLADRIGRVSSLRTGMLLHLIGIAICYLGFSLHLFSVLLVGRFLSALGSASGLVCAYILINESLDVHEAKSTFAYTTISFGFAATLAVVIGGFITQWLGWQYCFAFLFLHTLILIFMTKKVKETYPKKMRESVQAPKKDIQISTRNLMHLISFSLLMGFNTCVIYCYTTSAPLISKFHYALSPSAYSLWNTVNLGGMVIGSISAAVVMHRMKGMHIIRDGLLLFIAVLISFLLIFFISPKWPLWFFMTSSGMYFAGGWVFSAAGYYASNAIRNKALGTSLMTFVNLLSAVIGVVVLGYLPFESLLSFDVVFGIFLFIGASCYLWLRKEIKVS